jgi:hypothetical protein
VNCPDCGERMDHCHGTLVLHADVVECIDPSCATPYLASHALVVSCAEVDCPACAAAHSPAA